MPNSSNATAMRFAPISFSYRERERGQIPTPVNCPVTADNWPEHLGRLDEQEFVAVVRNVLRPHVHPDIWLARTRLIGRPFFVRQDNSPIRHLARTRLRCVGRREEIFPGIQQFAGAREILIHRDGIILEEHTLEELPALQEVWLHRSRSDYQAGTAALGNWDEETLDDEESIPINRVIPKKLRFGGEWKPEYSDLPPDPLMVYLRFTRSNRSITRDVTISLCNNQGDPLSHLLEFSVPMENGAEVGMTSLYTGIDSQISPFRLDLQGRLRVNTR